MTLMQGDAYCLSIEIRDQSGAVVTDSNIINMEITIGQLRKTSANGEVSYSDGLWMFPLSQEETFKFLPSKIKVQARIAWDSGCVEGCELGEIRVKESNSKEVL